MQNTEHQSDTPRPSKVTVLGLDVHAKEIVLVEGSDGRAKAAQRRSEADLFALVGRAIGRGEQVYSCYEAGCFGYGLHRKLTALGAVNYVIMPQDWDQRHERRKNDQRDARELWQRLCRYLQGGR
jgi:transposase